MRVTVVGKFINLNSIFETSRNLKIEKSSFWIVRKIGLYLTLRSWVQDGESIHGLKIEIVNPEMSGFFFVLHSVE